MERKEFRDVGQDILEWIDTYMAEGYDGPVIPQAAEPGDLKAQLPSLPPQDGEPAEQIFADFKRLILPRVTHWNDPRFMGYFPCNNSRPGTLGDLLSSGLGVNCMNWNTSPAGTELELQMMAWLGSMIGLDWPGCIQDTASTATIVAVHSAREKVAPVNKTGYYGQKPMTVYASTHANMVINRACWITGIGSDYLRLIPGDENHAMRLDVLKEQIEADVAAGLRPCMVMSTVGTTSTTAFDPVAEISKLCEQYDMWHHVDAAMAGSAAILPEMRERIMDGVAEADSFCFNPHKWLFTNFDCSVYFVKNPYYLKKALSIQPVYLDTAYDGSAENLRNWSPQLGRRFRALKLWWVIRDYGVKGLQEALRMHLDMTQKFAKWVKGHDDLALLIEPSLNTVCFYMKDQDKTAGLMQAVNGTGKVFLTHTQIDGIYVIRVSFGQTYSDYSHLDLLQQTLQECIAKMD